MVILCLLLAGISAYSLLTYINVQRENYRLADTLGDVQGESAVLRKEKQELTVNLSKSKELGATLTQENATLKEALKARDEAINRLDTELNQSQRSLQETESIKSQNATLIAERDDLTNRLNQLSQENESFKARLSSIPELKKAIKEVLASRHRPPAAPGQPPVSPQTLEETLDGNRGFLLKDGQSTVLGKVKIEVTPLQPNQ